MSNTILQLDFADKYEEARMFQRDHPDLPLADFFLTYPARFQKDNAPSQDDLNKPVSSFLFQPVRLGDQECVKFGEDSGRKLRNDLDGLWQEEQEGQFVSPPREDEPSEYPVKITDNTAVRTAYRDEMDTISKFLQNGLSVLVVCDKMLTELIYEFVCHKAGKKEVLDTAQPVETKRTMGGRTDQALQGGQANPLSNLPTLIRDLKPGEVLVLRSLDMLDNPPMIELLYQRTAKGEKPQILAFLDPSLDAKKVLTDRFAVHVPIMGLPRHISLDGKRTIYTVTHLLTQKERACFAKYNPEGLFKNVSGLNAVQFRNAMQYVGAMVEPGTDPQKIYREIRQFKTSSSSEIEIPDTTFDEIGGYEHIKQQLIRTIALIAGPIQGMDERQRGQLIPRGFVFHGPPGTGKTLFAKAIANEMNATIQMISGPEIMDKYVGESENNLRRIFATARRNAPAVVFFDEFDSIASQRSTYADGGARANNAVVAQFLTELDGFRQDQTMLIIGTTNRIDIIDEALLRPSRLRPIEIGLPDYAARKRVAQIHAKSFGVDELLKDLCILASRHLEKSSNAEQGVPKAFLDTLFVKHPPYKKRFDMEEQRAGFLRELKDFFAFVRQCRDKTVEQADLHILDKVDGRVVELGKHYGVDLTKEDLSMKNQEAEAWLTPMQSDIRDLFSLLQQERRKQDGLAPETFLNAILDLVAEYTINFNNDEIRAIFQEASLEHHMEGQLITPRYIGQKIGLIRKRRDERQAVHLSGRR
jgi:transitional endoplasmic reticulum ATPase